MSDIVERLRDQGRDAFARHYSLGMFKLCDEAAAEIERLRAQLAAPADALERAAAAWVLLSRWENIAKNGGERWLREHPLVKTTSELLSEEAALARSEEKGHG